MFYEHKSFHWIPTSSSMRYLTIFLLIAFIAGCNIKKEKCRFSTVADLDRLDLRECPPGDMYTHDTTYYYYIRKFSSGWDSIRQEKGIPKLPKDFQVITWSVDNQIRWRNAEAIEKMGVDSSYRHPFMQRKDIKWNNDTLIYDQTSFTEIYPLDTWVDISYKRDSVSGNYIFDYSYSDKTMAAGKYRSLTKSQADSILKAWKIEY
jgi:hypothetical protein